MPIARKKQLKTIATIAVLALTVTAFVYFFTKHPAALHQLAKTPPQILLFLIILYGVFTVCLVWIQMATLRLCDIQLPAKENLLLTVYSSIVNFFGPLQSGPGFRAIYLKQRHNVNLKNYTLATLLYYVSFALFSGLFLLYGVIGLWVLALLAIAFVAIPVTLQIPHPFITRFKTLQLRYMFQLAVATLAQLTTVAIIYYVELHSLHGNIKFWQALVYSGAADFALFVSLTPGAIGFRESFLLFSHNLHHISSTQVLSASLLDRATYVIFLGISFVFILGIHAQQLLGVKNIKTDTNNS